VDDIPGDDSVFGSWLVEPGIFAEFGLFAEQFFVAVPDLLTAAVELTAALKVVPREWLSEYIEVPA